MLKIKTMKLLIRYQRFTKKPCDKTVSMLARFIYVKIFLYDF